MEREHGEWRGLFLNLSEHNCIVCVWSKYCLFSLWFILLSCLSWLWHRASRSQTILDSSAGTSQIPVPVNMCVTYSSVPVRPWWVPSKNLGIEEFSGCSQANTFIWISYRPVCFVFLYLCRWMRWCWPWSRPSVQQQPCRATRLRSSSVKPAQCTTCTSSASGLKVNLVQLRVGSQ